jgi:hypothetical protein
MSNEESSDTRSIDERLQELKDNAKPDHKSNSSRYRELQASHGPKRLLRMLTKAERGASQAGVPGLLQAQEELLSDQAAQR